MKWKKFKTWLRSPFKKPNVIDSSTITKKLFPHTVYINSKGVLYFQGNNVKAEIIGVTEWPDYLKENYNVDLSTTVVDIIVNPVKHTE